MDWARTRKPAKATQTMRRPVTLWLGPSSNGLHRPDVRGIAEPYRTQRNIWLDRGHHLVKFSERKRLLTIAPGFCGVRMHLNDQAVRACRDAYACQCRY